MEISDQTIDEMQQAINAANFGSSDAFESLLVRFEQRFRFLVQHMLRGFPRLRRWEQTDDVFQTSMIRLMKSLTSAKPDSVGQFVGLAATQMRRTLLDLTRHHFGKQGGGHNHHSADGLAADDPEGIAHRGSMKNEPVTMDDWSAFHVAIEALPEQSRQAFELIWYAGLTQQEAAATLEISRRTLIRRLNQARTELTSVLVPSDNS